MSATASAPVMGIVPPGEDLLRTLEATCAAHDVAGGRVQITGALRRVVLRAAAGANPIVIEGPSELVTAVGIVDSGPVVLRGVVSWDDRGQPRMLAGLILEAVSDGARIVLEAWQAGAERRVGSGRAGVGPSAVHSGSQPAAASATGGSSASATTSATASARGPSSGRASSPAASRGPTPPPGRGAGHAPRSLPGQGRAAMHEDDEDDEDDEDELEADRAAELREEHVDLSTEQAALTTRPLPTSTGSGWAGVVAASQQTSRTGRAMPSPADLGFEAEGTPDLQRGDVLFHARLGRCVVMKGAGGGDKIKVRRAAGALVDLSIKALAFRRRPDEGATRVYEVRAH